jgi:hypothetical protein
MLTDWTGTQLSARAISYLVLVSIAFVLAAAGSWKQVRAALGREGPRAT